MELWWIVELSDSKKSQSLINNRDILEQRLRDIPNVPGCYLMKDDQETILYVGKSKSLRNRVRSYFRDLEKHNPRIRLMIRQIYDFEIIITDSESEALVLESNLIKDNQPYFNILLKDDKKYPYLCITWGDQYPRIFITRRRRYRNELDKFYGPYVDVGLLRQTLVLVQKIFPLRQRPRPLYKERTCLNYSIGRCPGVCQEKISSAEYHKTIQKVSMIFQGRTQELCRILEQQMANHSDNQNYESAAYIRDQIKGIVQLTESQKMSVLDSSLSRDIIALSRTDKIASIQIFQMRSGKLIGRLGYTHTASNQKDEEILQIVIEQHYSRVDSPEIPIEILVQHQLPKQEIISDWLGELKGRNVKVINPKRKTKQQIISLVERNASFELCRTLKAKEEQMTALEDLAELLELSIVPKRVECFDISHIQGSDAVASQVVFIEGLAAKQHYRKYRIKSPSVIPGHSDDFMSMKEVIRRRFLKYSRIKLEGVDLNQFKEPSHNVLIKDGFSDWPNLIVLDGGKGQLNSAIQVLKELELDEDVVVCSLAKRNEELYVPGASDPIESDKSQPGMMLLRRLRDEAHRFAIKYHRNKRSKRMTKSQLSDIPGLGPKRRKELFNHFRSIDAIQLASKEELGLVPGMGMAIASNVWNYFHPTETL